MRFVPLAMFVVAYASYAPQQQRPQVFRSHVQTVLVDVSVLRGHTPITNLAASDFTLRDNGAPQTIETITDAAIPLDVTIVMDASNVRLNPTTNAGHAELFRNIGQVASLMPTGDRLGIIAFGSDVIEVSRMTPASGAEIQLWNERTRLLSESLSNRYRMTQALLTALSEPVASDRRHLVVVFANPGGEPDAFPLDHLLSAAQRADALLYAVLTPPAVDEHYQPYPFHPEQIDLRNALTQAAEATGGKMYLTGDIVGAFKQLLRDFRSSYVLRYAVQGVSTAGWHDITVKVPSCSECTIHARHGYMGQ